MNNMDAKNISALGIVLTDNVDLDWLRSVEPRFYSDYIKFVVNLKTNKVCVGMDIHRNCEREMGDASDLRGGNIYFDDGHIVYTSTLNVPANVKIGEFGDTPRIMTNPELIKQVNNILFAWVKL